VWVTVEKEEACCTDRREEFELRIHLLVFWFYHSKNVNEVGCFSSFR
jgi:hypothetical protein